MKNYALGLLLIVCLIIVACSDSKDKHGMFLILKEGDELPLNLEVSDVDALIFKEKFVDFTGYKASWSASLKVNQVSDDGYSYSFIAKSCSIDSLYDFELPGNRTAVEQNMLQQLESNSSLIQGGKTGASGVFTATASLALTEFAAAFSHKNLDSYYKNRLDISSALVSSLYSFPGMMTKNYKWKDIISVELLDEENIPYNENIELEWELLRINDKEVTFFGKGKSSYSRDLFEVDNMDKLDPKRQYGVNLVIDRSNFWIKRGNIDLREELGAIIAQEEVGNLMRKPISVRNIKIKINPIQEK
jgi:hypothetical protein